MDDPEFDLITMGRSSLDLYAREVGAAFRDIQSFAAYVGGSPTNIAVGGRRLGLRTALLTALGEDPVGDFLLHFLDKEGVETAYIPRMADRRTSAVVLGIEPPDRFPLVYYRERCADLGLTIDNVLATPIGACKAFEFAGTNLSHEPSRSATLFAAEVAQKAGVPVVLDIDFRPDQWQDPRAFGVAVRSSLRLVDVVLGTTDEINAAVLEDPRQVSLTHSQVSGAQVSGDVAAAVARLLALGPERVVEKQGADGATVHRRGGTVAVDGFPVEVHNVLGAGDAFATGYLYGMVSGWGDERSARLGNALGAYIVTQHGCANFMPTYAEVMAFIAPFGGL